MNRTTALDRRHRRVLVGGIAASVAVHAALFAILRFEVPVLERTVAVLTFEAPAETNRTVEEEPALELLQLAVLSEPHSSAGAAALPPTGELAAATLAIAASSASIEATVTSVAEPAFETLAVVDPLTNAAIRPIAFDALPAVATTAEADEGDDGVEVYVPGSIGKAKRQWARGVGDADYGDGGRTRIGIISIGGGHCPMPGRVPVSW
jgi:hypothetical protein